MNDKKIDVILNVANAIGAAFIAVSSGLIVEWQTGMLLTTFGIVTYIGYFMLGLFTASLYIWAYKLALNHS